MKTLAALLVAALTLAVVGSAHAQPAKADADTTKIRDCIKQKAEEADGGDSCIFIIATPCTETRAGQSTHGTADCYRRETAIWDAILNESFRRLNEKLDAKQKTALRDMQRAWISVRDMTCKFYNDFYRGSMAVPMNAACLTRETARRALFLHRFAQQEPG